MPVSSAGGRYPKLLGVSVRSELSEELRCMLEFEVVRCRLEAELPRGVGIALGLLWCSVWSEKLVLILMP